MGRRGRLKGIGVGGCGGGELYSAPLRGLKPRSSARRWELSEEKGAAGPPRPESAARQRRPGGRVPRRGARGRRGGTDGGAQVRHQGARGRGLGCGASLGVGAASRGGACEAEGSAAGLRALRRPSAGSRRRRRGPDPSPARPPAAVTLASSARPSTCLSPAAGPEGTAGRRDRSPQAAELCWSNFAEPGPREQRRRPLLQLGTRGWRPQQPELRRAPSRGGLGGARKGFPGLVLASCRFLDWRSRMPGISVRGSPALTCDFVNFKGHRRCSLRTPGLRTLLPPPVSQSTPRLSTVYPQSTYFCSVLCFFFFLFNGAALCQTRLPFILSFKLPYLYHKVERLPG